MGYKSSFKMGKVYGSADLNEITKTFVSGGVGDTFEDGLPYNLSIINDLTNRLSTCGVVHESNDTLRVSIVNGKVKINSGRAVLNDGSICIVDDEGVSLDYTINAINYVYILNDTLINDNVPVCSIELPSDDDYILLAQIDTEGNVTDKRIFSTGKLIPSSANNFRNMKKKTINHSINKDGKTSVLEDLGTDSIVFMAINSSSVAIWDFQNNIKHCVKSGASTNGGYSGERIYVLSTTYSGIELVNVSHVDGTTWQFDYEAISSNGKASYDIYYI